MKLFVIESESLLEQKICSAGCSFEKSVAAKKKIVAEKKVIDNRN